MMYSEMKKSELDEILVGLNREYDKYLSRNLKLDMSRGVQGKEQLDLTQKMLDVLKDESDCVTEGGIDCRNYGLLDGIPEAKKIFAELLEVDSDNIIVGGNSSLNMMYDTVLRAYVYGVFGTDTPWGAQGKIKFLCPVPGYDRHFAICESLGIEMIPVEMNSDGPDMDTVERFVAGDESIKGIWCVPKYSNPDGVVYSDAVIERFAALKTKAKDFRIFWDNAYIVHSLTDTIAEQTNILKAAEKYGNQDKIFVFASTSKISFPGSGIAAMAASDGNIKQIKSIMTVQTIGPDKLNQMRHVRFFGNAEGIRNHMKQHAAILRPKFDTVLSAFDKELSDLGIAEWTKPEGGYFISLNVTDGCAKRVYKLMSGLGVKLTPAGAAFPYHNDPNNRNLRIAPTRPPLDELTVAANALCLCVKIACAEKLAGK